MKLKLLQHSSSAINSIYIFEDFIDDKNYIKHISNKIKQYTEVDEMQRMTNVKASMTNYTKLMEDSDFNFVHQKIIEFLCTVWTLRTPTPHHKTIFSLENSWGMRHKKGDFTISHIHNIPFSGAFYLNVPCLTQMWFEEYQQSLELKDNMLVLFPGFTKHAVFEHTGEEDRISMAFNISVRDS
jgi:hypothetical protein